MSRWTKKAYDRVHNQQLLKLDGFRRAGRPRATAERMRSYVDSLGRDTGSESLMIQFAAILGILGQGGRAGGLSAKNLRTLADRAATILEYADIIPVRSTLAGLHAELYLAVAANLRQLGRPAEALVEIERAKALGGVLDQDLLDRVAVEQAGNQLRLGSVVAALSTVASYAGASDMARLAVWRLRAEAMRLLGRLSDCADIVREAAAQLAAGPLREAMEWEGLLAKAQSQGDFRVIAAAARPHRVVTQPTLRLHAKVWLWASHDADLAARLPGVDRLLRGNVRGARYDPMAKIALELERATSGEATLPLQLNALTVAARVSASCWRLTDELIALAAIARVADRGPSKTLTALLIDRYGTLCRRFGQVNALGLQNLPAQSST